MYILQERISRKMRKRHVLRLVRILAWLEIGLQVMKSFERVVKKNISLKKSVIKLNC